MSAQARLSIAIASDGERIVLYDWPCPTNLTQRATVLLVHGLGEYAGRYEALAQQLNAWGFAVRSYDQYGHGRSGGQRGDLPHSDRLLHDLAESVDTVRAQEAPNMPLVLLGHSMGGLVAARFVSLGLRPVDALVLSSPALRVRISALEKILLSVARPLLPHLCVRNGLDAHKISRASAVVQAYLQDPLVHPYISTQLGAFIAQAGPATLAQAPQWHTPTLLLYAGQDALVNPQGSRDFAAAAPAQWVQSQCFAAMYHEIFNEPEAAQVFAALQQWLDQRF